MRFFDNNTRNPDAYYEPNSFKRPEGRKSASPSRRCPCTATPTATTTATGTTTIRNPAICFRLFSAEHRQRLFDNIAAAMHGVPDEIKRRQVRVVRQVRPGLRCRRGQGAEARPPG